MACLPGTNAVIAVLKDPNGPVGRRLGKLAPEDVFLPSIVLHELFYGAFKSARLGANVAVVASLRLGVLEFSREDARAAGEVRALLTAPGTPIGPYDVLIAGQGVARELVLVTPYARALGRVPRLLVEGWA